MESPPAAVRGSILVVEDEALIRVMTAEELRSCGFEVVEAGDAAEALDILRRRAFDLVLTDVRMPGTMDGVELARWIKARSPHTKIIIATGYAGVEIAEELCAGGAVLMKPYLPDQLVKRIEDALDGRRASPRPTLGSLLD